MDTIGAIATRLIHRSQQAAAERAAFDKELERTPPKARYCPKHGCALHFDATQSWIKTRELGERTIVYSECDKCKTEAWMERVGVPGNLLHCEFDNFKDKTPGHKAALEDAKEFAARKTGVLQLLGPVGTGKTHLAVATLRAVHSGRIITQLALLNSLRAQYRNEHAEDMVAKCKRTHLLVLDEVGLSVGGRDELPMLHDILCHRISAKMRTVITGNIKPDELEGVFGERVVDRLREATFRVCIMTGDSERRARRKEYLRD